MKKLFESVTHNCQQHLPVQKEELALLCEKAIHVLETYSQDIRPCSDFEGVPGGLLDFTKVQKKPVIIVPDLHARPDFIPNLFNCDITFSDCSGKIFKLLEEDRIRIVLVGDILHSEKRQKERWIAASKDYINGNPCGKAMQEEMIEGLGTLMQVMTGICMFPSNFFCLKGNHENIKNELGNGNYPFKKFAFEGEMTYRFMQEWYGDSVVESVSRYEKLLPLACFHHKGIISHAEPLKAYSQKQIINGMTDDSIIEGLTWTANDEAECTSVEKMLSSFGSDAFYTGGHRVICDDYALRQNGRYIQIHNPQKENILFVPVDEDLDLNKHIISVIPGDKK